jgi:hypothetical protein
MPQIPEHLLRRTAEARAKALGVPVEEVLAEMGMAAEGEIVPPALEETGEVSPAKGTTIPEDLQEREDTARVAGLEKVHAEAEAKPALATAEPAAEPEPVPEPVAEKPAAAAGPGGAKIPEALLRRSAEAKAKATGRPVEEIMAEMSGGEPAAAPAAEEPAPEPEPVPEPVAEKPAAVAAGPGGAKIPEALLRRSAEAKAKATGRPVEEIMAEMSGGEPAPAPAAAEPAAKPAPAVEAPAAAAVPAPAAAVPPAPVTPTPPEATEELPKPRSLTVLRAKSIERVAAAPEDKVNVWPHLLLIEFVALLGVTAFLIVLSVVLQAPLLELANFNATPNPAKAPWYFLGLQELLSYFDPQIAGVTVPTIVGLIGLMAVPYVDRNPSTKPADRKFAIMFFTFFLVAAATLTMLGVLFRGPGFNFSYPWSDGIWFDDLKDWISFE